MSYLNSVTIIGFVGADPEQRQARNNGSKFTVLSVATQRAWKNTEDEWVSKVEWHRVAIFRPRLAEAVLNNIKKGAHVLVEGSLVSSTYEQPSPPAARESFERHAQLRHFLHRCVTRGDLTDVDLDLLIQFKLGETGGKDFPTSNGHASNAVRQRLKRLLVKLRQLAK